MAVVVTAVAALAAGYLFGRLRPWQGSEPCDTRYHGPGE